jgi:hypothetical protein
MPAEAIIENDYVKIEGSAWIEDKTTPSELLDNLFEGWMEGGAEYPYGPIQFLGWLALQPNEDNDWKPYEIKAPHWFGGGVEALRLGNTQNEENSLDEAFGYLLFTLDGAKMVAIMPGTRVENPSFYELTCDEMENFISWNQLWIQCEATEAACVGAHTFETDDGTNWRYYDENSGQTVGDSFKLREIQDDEGRTICPRCKSEIKKAGSQI